MRHEVHILASKRVKSPRAPERGGARQAEQYRVLARLTAELAGLTNPDQVSRELVRGISREFGFRRTGFLQFDRGALMLRGRDSTGVPAALFREVRIPLVDPPEPFRTAVLAGRSTVVSAEEAASGSASLYRALRRAPQGHAVLPVAGGARRCWQELRCGNRLCPFYRNNGGAALDAVERRGGLAAARSRIEGFLRCERFPIYGVLWIETENATRDLLPLQSLARSAGTILDNSHLYRRLQYLSAIDPLTGVNNRRSFLRSLEAEVIRSGRSGGQFAVVMLDLDNFKAFNDAHGHLAGDRAMKAVGEVLLRTLRRSDVAARYGGEEFAVILPDATLEAAGAVAERVRAQIENLSIAGAHPRVITVSAGVAAFPTSTPVREETLAAADRALYHAKSAGKNRVVVMGPAETIHTLEPGKPHHA
jgi:diguanylate cyclase (GGDEF)-like protein